MERIPKHFRMLACDLRAKKGAVTFRLRCDCGNETFYARQGRSTAGKRAEAEWERYWHKYKWVPIFSFCSATERKSGRPYIYGRTFFGIRVGRFYTDQLRVKDFCFVKITCEKCQKEHAVFDSRVHGYDAIAEACDAEIAVTRGVTETSDGEEVSLRRLCKGKACTLEVALTYSVPHEDFREDFRGALGETATDEAYAEAFSTIALSAVVDGKRRKVFDFETA